MYDIERIRQAYSVSDAVAALVADERAVVICGGSDVLVKIREGKLAGCSLVSIHNIGELRGVRMEEDGTLVIGPGTTFSHLTNDPLVRAHIPLLGYAVDQAGGPQLRNVGTVGGNICNGATSADSAPALLALGAELEITGPGGVRRTPLDGFYEGPGKVRLARDELLTAIRVAKPDYAGFGGHYIKYAQREAMDIATLGCAVSLRLGADKETVEDLRLAFGVAAPTPVRCRGTEERMRGRPLDEVLRTIGGAAIAEVRPRTSWRASREFRLQLVRELSARAAAQAAVHAGGEASR